jgi:hypothetical protein
MLERNSPFGAISLPVYQTFWMAWRGWAAFYLSTAALLAATGALVATVFAGAGLWGRIAAVAIAVVVWLIYFRLLGRLAWYCTEHMSRAEPEADADAAKGRHNDNSTAHGVGP